MWGACVGVYQLLNWKMHGETLKLGERLFILLSYDLFNNAAINCLYHTEWVMNVHCGRMWQEKMAVKSEVLHWYLSDETEENHGKTQSEYPMCRYSNLIPPEYKQWVLLTLSPCGHICACPCMARVATPCVKKKGTQQFELIFSSTNTDREKLNIHNPNVPHIATFVTTNIWRSPHARARAHTHTHTHT